MRPKNLITTDFIDLDAPSNACLCSRGEVRKDAITFSQNPEGRILMLPTGSFLAMEQG